MVGISDQMMAAAQRADERMAALFDYDGEGIPQAMAYADALNALAGTDLPAADARWLIDHTAERCVVLIALGALASSPSDAIKGQLMHMVLTLIFHGEAGAA